MVPTDITTYTCDVCGYSTENNRGCCGSAPIMQCQLCKDDVCRTCRECFEENPCGDYCDVIVCTNCEPKFKEAWEWALEYAGRNDAIDDVAIERYKEIT